MPTSDRLLKLLLLAHPVQVDLIDHRRHHHDPDHHAESRAEDPHGL